MDLIQTWYDDGYYCTLHFDTSLIDLYFDSRSQECEKAKTAVPVISEIFSEFEWNLVTVETCCCDEPHAHYILSFQYSRERTLLIRFLIKKTLKLLTLARIQSFTDQFLSNIV